MFFCFFLFQLFYFAFVSDLFVCVFVDTLRGNNRNSIAEAALVCISAAIWTTIAKTIITLETTWLIIVTTLDAILLVL